MDRCRLSPDEVRSDSEQGLGELCHPLMPNVEVFATTSIARSIVDLDRPVDDRGRDGVVKTHTRWGVPIYREALPERQIEALLRRYYWPFHEQLQLRAPRAQLGLDWHGVRSAGAVAADRPRRAARRPVQAVRPRVVLRAAPGVPRPWVTTLGAALSRQLDATTTTIHQGLGTHIASSTPGGIRWIRVELSHAVELAAQGGAERLHEALSEFTRYLHNLGRGRP